MSTATSHETILKITHRIANSASHDFSVFVFSNGLHIMETIQAIVAVVIVLDARRSAVNAIWHSFNFPPAQQTTQLSTLHCDTVTGKTLIKAPHSNLSTSSATNYIGA
jgi:hypothetical protein